MTSISNSGPAKVESWMVSKLFGSSSQDQSGNQTSSSPTSVIQIAAGASSAISGSTAGAVASLKQGGSVEKSEASNTPDPWAPGERPMKTVTQSREIMEQHDKMTSKQVNDAMYGNGITATGGFIDEPNHTFAELQANQDNITNWTLQQAADTSLPDDYRQEMLADAVREKVQTDAMQASYDNHTLVFQQASEVQGLDFNKTQTVTSFAPDKPMTGGSISESYNQSFIADQSDGKSHTLLEMDGLSMFVTW